MTGLGPEDVGPSAGFITYWVHNCGEVISYPSFHFCTCEMGVVTLILSPF